MTLTIAGLKFDANPEFVFTDDQPMPTLRGPIVVTARLDGADLERLKHAIDEDERAVYETAHCRAEIEFRSFVYVPAEGVVRQFEGADIRAFAWKK